jgi:hypothetical protein
MYLKLKIKIMKQQTAVEYLYKNLLDNPISNEDVIYNINIFEKAKEIEKEQITDAYLEGGRKGFNFFGDDFEKYYEETYTQSSE